MALSTLVAGCLGTECEGETYTGVSYRISLRDVDYRDDPGTWTARCALSVDVEYARGGAGLHDAKIGAFDRRGNLLTAVPVGDLTWSNVPEKRRYTIDAGCEGTYSGGSVDAVERFAVETFPFYFGALYSKRGGQPTGVTEEVRYAGDEAPDTDPELSEYERIEVDAYRSRSGDRPGIAVGTTRNGTDARTPGRVDEEDGRSWIPTRDR